MKFTEHEKRLISGAILAQMANISKAMENVGYTGDGELIDGLYKHNRELKELNSKVCSMMDDEDGNEDDFFEICYKSEYGEEQVDTSRDVAAAIRLADSFLHDFANNSDPGESIIVKKYVFEQVVYNKEIYAKEE